MKKLAILLVAGSIVISGATAGLNTVKAADAKIIDKNMDLKETDKDFFAYPGNTDFRELDKDFFAYPGKGESLKALSEFLKKDTKLTKAEKKSNNPPLQSGKLTYWLDKICLFYGSTQFALAGECCHDLQK